MTDSASAVDASTEPICRWANGGRRLWTANVIKLIRVRPCLVRTSPSASSSLPRHWRFQQCRYPARMSPECAGDRRFERRFRCERAFVYLDSVAPRPAECKEDRHREFTETGQNPKAPLRRIPGAICQSVSTGTLPITGRISHARAVCNGKLRVSGILPFYLYAKVGHLQPAWEHHQCEREGCACHCE